MKDHWKYLIPLIVVIGVFIFYWVELRPTFIRKDCSKQVAEEILGKRDLGVTDGSPERRAEFDWWYKTCLNKNGLEE